MIRKKDLLERIEALEKQHEVDVRTVSVKRFHYWGASIIDSHVPTLRGKVDAILEHLGLDVEIKSTPAREAEYEVALKKAKK